MSSDAPLSGPDFSAGIDQDVLASGAKLLGHAGGEAVLLTRIGDEYLAIGASCTHYGGPLAEGVIDGETVRCPWHHACFSLRTGEALRAPALNPVAQWKVVRQGDRIVVTEKVERDPLAPTYPIARHDTVPSSIVIVGAGAAGAAAAEMLRRCAYAGALTVIDSEPDSPYDRPNLSKDYLAGNAPEEWIPIRQAGFYAEHRIDIVRGNVSRIDVAGRQVVVEGRPPVAYDALLLATGAEPVKLQFPGVDLPHVHYLRSLGDSRRIIAAAREATKAVIVGTSFIGLEVAASLRARNVETHIVAPEPIPMERVLGAELGSFIKGLHESKGVRFHLGRKPQAIDREAMTLDDGSKLTADLVVIGVGVRPRVALAEQAGLAMDRGVTVNEYLETSVPGIYAAGDIARWPDRHSRERIRVEHWVVAERMGQTAARNILGARERFDDVPFFWSAQYDVSINYVGHAEKWDRVVIDGSAEQRDLSARFQLGDKTLAVATLFRDEESLKAEMEMERTTA